MTVETASPQLPAPLAPGQGFADLMQGADTVSGASLFKDEGLNTLVGIPFLIHSITFRPGIIRDGIQQDYVSIEALLADAETMRRAIKRGQFTAVQAELLQPEENIILNDGSTGIFRQVVKYLNDNGYIALPEGPESGDKGNCRYDLPRTSWEGTAVEMTVENDGTLSDTTYPVRLFCPRGLRVSEYTSPVNPSEKARTFYLA